jgi:hypothetical protein
MNIYISYKKVNMTILKTIRIMASSTLAAMLIVSTLARAHSDEYFDSKPSPHGGQVRMSGPFHFELVLREDRIIVYVSDHADKTIETVGATAKIEIDVEGKTSKFDLSPAEGNLLSAEWKPPASQNLTARLSVKLPGQKTYSVKFTPLAKKSK